MLLQSTAEIEYSFEMVGQTVINKYDYKMSRVINNDVNVFYLANGDTITTIEQDKLFDDYFLCINNIAYNITKTKRR